MTSLAKLLEAALFASARPIPFDELSALDPDASPAALRSALDEVREHYDVEGHGVELVEIGAGVADGVVPLEPGVGDVPEIPLLRADDEDVLHGPTSRPGAGP